MIKSPIVSIEENDDGFLVKLDRSEYGWTLMFSLEELEVFNNSITDFLNNRAVEDLGDFSLDDGDCESCKI